MKTNNNINEKREKVIVIDNGPKTRAEALRLSDILFDNLDSTLNHTEVILVLKALRNGLDNAIRNA